MWRPTRAAATSVRCMRASGPCDQVAVIAAAGSPLVVEQPAPSSAAHTASHATEVRMETSVRPTEDEQGGFSQDGRRVVYGDEAGAGVRPARRRSGAA